MTEPIAVPKAPALSHLPQVELMHVGTWDASTGRHTFTPDDLAFAVAAMDCPAVHRPHIKLGHTDPRFDGEPAAGWVDNLAVNGGTLVGDLVGMPGWLATPDEFGHTVIASAYPNRSIEGQYDYRCALGHCHPFVLTALALLGISEPAIGTLASLQDVGALYGVAAGAAPSTGGTYIAVHMKGPAMPNPKALTVAAGVTTEDVRRKFYDSAPWSQWIEEFHLEPLELIVLDDDSGTRQRVPVIVDPAGDGTEGVTFGAAVPVVVRYDDVTPGAPDPAADPAADAAPDDTAVAASKVLRYASRAESRPGRPAAAAPTPAAPADGAPNEGGSGVELTNEQLAALRTALGLADDADIDAIVTAIQDLASTAADQAQQAADDAATAADAVAASKLPDGVVTVDSGRLAALEANSAKFEAFLASKRRDDIEVALSGAIKDGRITPANKETWRKTLDNDLEHGQTLLASMAANSAVPVSELGHSTEPVEAKVADDPRFKEWSL